jgi:serine/threonine protein phosphatase 1
MSAGRRFVIGDVHGCVDELERLLDGVAPTADDSLCFLGDYVDRGPNPRGVIERLIRLQAEGPQCIFLKGNHEDMFLAFLGRPGRHGDAFLWNGGNATLASYGCDGLWIREEFISQPHPYPYTVLFGHTPQRDVLVDLPFKIGLDTGLVYGNRLSCLELDAQRVWQVRNGERRVSQRDLAPRPS